MGSGAPDKALIASAQKITDRVPNMFAIKRIQILLLALSNDADVRNSELARNMAEQKATPRSPIESGCPDGFQYMHPAYIKNYGQWKYHDRPRPGVLHHVAESGDEVWTIRVGTQRQLGAYEINLLCDIIDKYADGYVRFTIRSNMEISVTE